MTVSITDLNSSKINTATQGKKVPDTRNEINTESQKQGNHKSADTVTFTESARLIQDLEKKIKAMPVVDAEKVAKVRENLSSGNYNISPERIAAKLLQYESLLGTAQ